jgi:2'-5' RNA ligase
MSGQLSFLDLVEPAEPVDQLFFAILPDAAAAGEMSRLAQRLCGEHRLRARPLAAERFHVTLFPLGSYAGVPSHIVAMATEAAGSLAAPPFRVTFDSAMSFSRNAGKKPLVLQGGEGLAALLEFRAQLALAMAKAGFGGLSKSKYTPHVTLLYDEHAVAEQAVPPIGWTVSELVLVHSLVGLTRHERLGTWPLKA